MMAESDAQRDRPKPPEARHGLYQLFMLALCIYAIGALAVATVAPVSPATREILGYADLAVCAIFFTDFLLQLARAKDRWFYFSRWGWLDLLSSIPMVEALRIGRLARILRIIQIMRGVKATKVVSAAILDRRAEGAFLAAALVSILLVVLASIAVVEFERVEGANITTAGDAIWWAFSTITTVGYGDRFPTTSEGRVIAVLLMSVGVGLFGTFSGLMAAWFLSPAKAKGSTDLRELREEIAALRRLLEHPANSHDAMGVATAVSPSQVPDRPGVSTQA